MKVTVDQSDLVKGLNLVSKALSSRNQLPVLANVLIEAKKSGVILAATNLEVGIRTQIGSKTEREGVITVPARSLTEFVTSVIGHQVQLESNEGKLKVVADKFRATFSGIDAAEFPILPQPSKSTQTINALIVGQIATQVAYAAAVDESRPVLTGIRFQVLGDKLIVVATDGFRLVRKEFLASSIKNLASIIMPARTIVEIAKIASDTKEDKVGMEVVEKNNQVIFTCGATDLISRILEGNYPDTEKIIPTDSPIEAILDRQEFMQSLRAVGIFARENNNIVRFKIKNSKFNISAAATQQGESEVEMESENTGEGEIAFNYKFVTDVLGSMSEERIRLQIKDHLSPGVFRPEKDSSLLALVMPVRI